MVVSTQVSPGRPTSQAFVFSSFAFHDRPDEGTAVLHAQSGITAFENSCKPPTPPACAGPRIMRSRPASSGIRASLSVPDQSPRARSGAGADGSHHGPIGDFVIRWGDLQRLSCHGGLRPQRYAKSGVEQLERIHFEAAASVVLCPEGISQECGSRARCRHHAASSLRWNRVRTEKNLAAGPNSLDASRSA